MKKATEETCLWFELNESQSNSAVREGLCEENKKWEPPLRDFAKCTIYANWRNAKLHSRSFEITVVMFYTMLGMLSPFPLNRLTAELRCLEWALQSMKDLGYHEVIVGSDLRDLIEAMMKPLNWPRYRIILHRINALCSSFASVAFETESMQSNRIAREIGKSVLRDGRFHSYLALGGPAWLHHQILREVT